MALKGELADVPINEVFSLIKHVKSSGVLEINSGGKKLKVHFINGEVVNAEGDASPKASLELVLGLKDGSFEFDKNSTPEKTDNPKQLNEILNNISKIQKEWENLRNVFPNDNIIISLSETNKEEIELSGKEWKVISILKNPKTISEIVKESGMGTLELLKVLDSMLKKDLIAITGIKNTEPNIEKDLADIVPVRNLGYWAMRSPIEGIKAIEFYRRIDDKKTVGEIAKEMGISLKEAVEILEYLAKNDKIEKRPKRK